MEAGARWRLLSSANRHESKTLADTVGIQYRRYRVASTLVSTAERATQPPASRTPRAEVRERILAAAEREFIERGYAGANLASIARRAGFTKGAVYSNFESKQSLLTAMLSDRSARVSRSALSRLARAGARDADLAERAADLLAGEVIANREWNRLLTELALHAAEDPEAARGYADFRQAQRMALARALADNSAALGLRPDADLDGPAFLLVTTMTAMAIERAADPRTVSRRRIASALTTVLTALIEQAAEPQGP